MWKKLHRLVFGRDCELRDRMLRTIIMVGGLVTIVGIGEILLTMELNALLITFLVILLVVMGTSLFITFKYGKYDAAATLIGFLIIVIVFPVMFLLSGGLDGGPSIWMTLGIFYMFVMFTGKKLAVFTVLCAIMYGGAYMLAYFRPDLIVPMGSMSAAYIDSFFSVFAVGICTGLVIKIQMKVFEEEHRQNILQREELERTSNSKNVFFANMSHEIRTPINTIVGLNEMILRRNPGGEVRDYALDIQLASKMLLNQVNDILDLSQMEMKKMKVIPVEYRTEDLFVELVELILVQAEKKRLNLFVEVDKTIPSVLYGDEKRIKQIILNLLDNAVKYTQEGGVTLTASGEEDENGEYILKVQVADTGIGIRKEDIEYLYDSFNRVEEKRNRRIVGSGLGLAITKQLVDLMDGEITVDSIYTKGSTFSVSLNQKIVDKTPVGSIKFGERADQDGKSYAALFTAPEARVLVVDDNRMNAQVAQKLLSFTQMQIDLAESGMECLEMAKKKYYHLILLDYMMPGMNGQETLKALRDQENGLCRETPVVALTANAVADAGQQYREQGFDGYVEKPVQGRALEEEILRFLPPEIVKLQEDVSETGAARNIGRITGKRRKKIYVTADCVCDIPADLLEKYNVKLMYLYIRTPNGRFADTREIDSDSLAQYMTADSSSVYADSVTVQEYEEFFAEMLTEAEEVIHVSMSSEIGGSFHIAQAAAKGFDHVHVIDSEQVSGGMGLVTLMAAKMVMEGKRADDICEEVEKMKHHVRTCFIMPGADVYMQSGRTSSLVARLCKNFHLRPVANIRQKKIVLTSLRGGSLENVWRWGIRRHLRKKRKISRQIILVTHVGCSVKQLEWIKSEILKCVPFDRVMIQKASLTVACNSGLESIGISYYEAEDKKTVI